MTQSPRKSGFRWKRLVAVFVVLAVGVVAFYTQTRPDLPPLLPVAHRVVSLDGFSSRCVWLSNRELLLCRDPARQDFTLLRQDIETGAQTPLTALTQLCRSSGGKPETLQVSPVGGWLLWTGAGNTTWLATLDGRRHYTVQEKGPRRNVWKCDGQGWFALHLDGDSIDMVTERHLEAPQKVIRSVGIAFPFPNSPDQVNLERITSTEDESLLVPLWKSGKGNLDQADIVATGFGANPMAVKNLKFAAPYLNLGGDMAFSPLSYKMAWRLDILLPRARFLHDLGLGNASRHSVALWITDWKTNQNRIAGYVDVTSSDPASSLTNVQFSPSGMNLSFVYRNALWTVPTE